MNYTGYSSPRSNAVVLNLISVHLFWENAQWMLGCNPFIVIELDISDIMNMLIILDLDNLNLLTLIGKKSIFAFGKYLCFFAFFNLIAKNQRNRLTFTCPKFYLEKSTSIPKSSCDQAKHLTTKPSVTSPKKRASSYLERNQVVHT